MATRGRKRGPATIPFPLRLRIDQRTDLEFLQDATDGSPPINGLIQLAIDRYIAAKLAEPDLRAAYQRRVNPRLQVLKDNPGTASE